MTVGRFTLSLTLLALVACSGGRRSSVVPGSAATLGSGTSPVSSGSGATAPASTGTVTQGRLALGAVTPALGELARATPLELAGSGFAPGLRVFFAGQEANDVVVLDAQRATCTSPLLTSGAHDVLLVRPDGATAELGAGFRTRLAVTPDLAFAPNGLLLEPGLRADEELLALFVDDQGRSLELLAAYTAPESRRLVRRSAAGVVESSVALDPALVASVAFDSQGRLLAVPRAPVTSAAPFRVRRFLTDGSVDATYAGGPIDLPTFGAGGYSDRSYALAVDRQDRALVVARQANNPGGQGERYRAVVTRCTSAGQLDATFGAGGYYVHASRYEPVFATLVRADAAGRVLLHMGTSRDVTGGAFVDGVLSRVSAAGTPDAGFGIVFTGSRTLALGEDASGRLLLGARSAGALVVRRLLASGALDATFGVGGEALLGVPTGPNARLTDLALDRRTGELVVAGVDQERQRGWVLDATGAQRGTAFLPAPAPANAAAPGSGLHVVLDPWGRALLGTTNPTAGQGGVALWRIR